ncbi:MAG: DUF167 domain-containing protein [Chloroflexi bacterium]|nr:DUF167 domain-containing protein [Chloroflexota bacterium]
MTEQQQARIVVRVQPNAGRNEVSGFRDGVWHVRVAAPPVKGKANQELVKFLSAVLGVSKSNLTIEKGLTSKTKTIAVRGLTQSYATELLERL